MNKKTFLLFLLVLATASFFRLWELTNLPGGLFPDEAANGQDALLILKGHFSPFFERGLGREGLYFYLLALSLKLFGIGVWQIHLVSALIGIFTVVFTWFFVKKLFNKTTAFFTAFFLATSTWHTTLSRTGFRGILVPLFSVLFFYLAYSVFKAKTNKKRKLLALLSGLVLGLGFYTYIPFRSMIGIIPLLAVIIFLGERKIFTNYWKEITIAIIACAVTISPLIFYFIKHPHSFIGRTNCVSIFNPDLNHGDIIGTLLEVSKKTLLMFFTKGDLNWRHNVSGFSMLNPIVALFFALGFLYSLLKILVNFFRKKPLKTYFKYLFLIVWFFAMLGPELLSAQAIPHGLRAIGAIPPVFCFSAISLETLLKRKNIKKRKALLLVSLIFILSLSFSIDYTLYFKISANSPGFYYAYRSDLTEISDYLNKRNNKEKTYLVLDAYSVQTPDFLTIEKGNPYILIDPVKSYEVKMEKGDQIVFTQSTIFDAKKFVVFHPNAKLIKKSFNKFGQEIMRIYEK